MSLVLTRNPSQRVIVRHGGEELVVTYLGINRHRDGAISSQIKLAFTGAHGFEIVREEVQQRIDAEYDAPTTRSADDKFEERY